MLTHLFIRNFVLVTETEIEWHSGLTILTGETGAGKSIIFDALGLAMGNRAESRLIRHGCDQAEIVATFQEVTPEVTAWMAQHELERSDPQELILRRVIRADGRSRAYINGVPSTTQSLRDLSSLLIDIQGQHAHQRLLKSDEQLRLLDRYAGTDSLLEQMAQQFQCWRQLVNEKSTLEQNEAERHDRATLLQFQLQELDQLGLMPDELQQLEEEQSRLANGEQLLERSQLALQLLNGESEQSAVQQLYRTITQLESLEPLDPAIQPLRERLLDSALQADETASELQRQTEQYTLDPERLQWLNQRLSTISDLARKHRCSGNALPEKHHELQQQLEQLLSTAQQLGEIEEKIEKAHSNCSDTAEQLHQLRREAALRLEQEVSLEIQALGMEQGEFRISLSQLSNREFRSSGRDEIQFLVTTNSGSPSQPLAKIASGGELSRISLAIQIASASQGQTPTLIFDEVDSGVGGGTAERIGQKLHTLGNHAQILCVTHLPQVAACGHQQIRIEKASDRSSPETADNDQQGTVSRIIPLDGEQRIEEIARMLGGVRITSQSRAHAREMLGSG